MSLWRVIPWYSDDPNPGVIAFLDAPSEAAAHAIWQAENPDDEAVELDVRPLGEPAA